MVTAISARSFAGSYTNDDEDGVKIYPRRKDIPNEAFDNRTIKKDRLSMGAFTLLFVSFCVSLLTIFYLFLSLSFSFGVPLGSILILFFSVPICVSAFRKLVEKGYSKKRILIQGMLTLIIWVAFIIGESIWAIRMVFDRGMGNVYMLMVGSAALAAVFVIIHGYKRY